MWRMVPFVLMSAIAGLFVGCDAGDKSTPPSSAVPVATNQAVQISWGEAPLERRLEFLKSMIAAMRDFDELYDSKIGIGIEELSPGEATVVVRGYDQRSDVGRALAVAMTNFAHRYPMLRFMAIDKNAWKVVVPDGQNIPLSGEFHLSVP